MHDGLTKLEMLTGLKPPSDAGLERKFLSALLVGRNDHPAVKWAKRNIQPTDFAEPLHGFLFEAICHAQKEGDEAKMIASRLLDPKVRRYATRKFGADMLLELHRLFFGQDGSGHFGFVWHLRYYGNKLRDIAMFRQKIEVAFKELNDTWETWRGFATEHGRGY